jgi:hypothetical protein
MVTATAITTTHGSRSGTHYHAHITYRYFVNGTEYRGGRYRYDGHPTDETSVNAIIAAHPKDSEIEVYYNPEEPRDTVLSPGVDSGDVGLPLMLLAVMLFMLFPSVPACRQMILGKNPVAGGVKIISEMIVTRVRLPRYEPAALALATAAALSLLAAILVSTSALRPPWQAGQWSLGGIALGGVVVYVLLQQKVSSGRQDLVIDEGSRTLQLPLTYKRREQNPLPFTDIRGVLSVPVLHRSRRGTYYTYMVTLERADGTREKLVDLNQERADAFVGWLREKLGVAVSTPVAKAEDS